MALQDISFGNVLSHLRERFRRLEEELRTGGGNIAGVLRGLNLDPVYRYLQDFRLPVPDCPQLAGLRTQVDEVEKAAGDLVEKLRKEQTDKVEQVGNAVKPFIATARNFIQGYQSRWDDNSYFIVPVYVTSIDQPGKAGMVYLRRFNPDELRSAVALWNIEGLTQDGNLLQFNRNYFNEIANVLMGVLYFTEYQRPHADPGQLRSDHVYELLFGCEITHGKSHGGAILAMFAICYLYSALGSNYLNYIAPAPGTVISAAIEPDGKVAKVDYVEDKVRCAIEEYGPGITVIIPEENRLPRELEENISPGHIHYVSAAEELLEKALFSGDSSRKMDDVRSALFRRLGNPSLESVFENLRTEITPDEIKNR